DPLALGVRAGLLGLHQIVDDENIGAVPGDGPCRAQKPHPGNFPPCRMEWDTPAAATGAGGVGDTMDDMGDCGVPQAEGAAGSGEPLFETSSSVGIHGRSCCIPIGNSGSRQGDGIPTGETCCSLSSPRRSCDGTAKGGGPIGAGAQDPGEEPD